MPKTEIVRDRDFNSSMTEIVRDR